MISEAISLLDRIFPKHPRSVAAVALVVLLASAVGGWLWHTSEERNERLNADIQRLERTQGELAELGADYQALLQEQARLDLSAEVVLSRYPTGGRRPDGNLDCPRVQDFVNELAPFPKKYADLERKFGSLLARAYKLAAEDPRLHIVEQFRGVKSQTGSVIAELENMPNPCNVTLPP